MKANEYKARERWDKIILWACILIGVAVGAFICYQAYNSIPRFDVCSLTPTTLNLSYIDLVLQYGLILNDNFSTLDTTIWNHEIRIGGGG